MATSRRERADAATDRAAEPGPWIDGRELIGFRVLTDDGVEIGRVTEDPGGVTTLLVVAWERLRRRRRHVAVNKILRVDRARHVVHLDIPVSETPADQ